jgi:type VI protein secretion system component Hcp
MTGQLSGQVVLSSILADEDTTGTVATFSDTDTNDVAGDFTATVNWGDGTTEVGTVTGQNGSFAVAVPGSTHVYANTGTDPITVTVTGPPPGSLAPSNLTYFLAIDGVNGGSTAANHVGWFQVSSYDVGALVAAMAGQATFSPLTVTLPSTGLTDVLADLAKGTVIPSVRLEGVTSGGGGKAVYDLTLGNVTVNDYQDAASVAAGPGGDTLSFSYQQVALTTRAINSNGTLGGSQTFSWDLTTNSVPSASIPAPVPGTAGGNVPPGNLDYFLAIDGLNGGSLDINHRGWFEVSSYDVGALVAAMGGQATFSPLTVTLGKTDLTAFLADIAKGTVIPSVRLEGVTRSTTTPQAAYDLTLGNVTVSDYEDAPGGDTLSLSYQQVALTTRAINSNGSLGGSQSFSWNLATNSTDVFIPQPTPATGSSVSVASNLTYFLAIDGLKGGSTDANHQGWFQVSSYDVGALVAAMAGQATFSPLTVTLPSTGLTGVLADRASGTVIPSVRLEGITGGTVPRAVYDLTLGNVTVSDYKDASGGDTLSLSYQQVELTTKTFNKLGSPVASQSFSWDLTTNSVPSVPIPAPVPGTSNNQITLTGTVSVATAGPSITSVVPSVVENGQTTEIGIVTPGVAGDTLTLQRTGGNGALALQLVGGVEEVIYTAPPAIAATAVDTVSYTISDQNGATATDSASVQLDAGPTAGTTSIVVGHNQTLDETALVEGLISAGLPGDTETIISVTGNATLSGSGITYNSPASGSDSFAYTVQDQLGDTATGTVNVTVDPGPTAGSAGIIVGHNQTLDETALVDGLITVALPGDTVAITSVTGNATLSGSGITYNSPASGSDSFAYTVRDQLGDTATGKVNVTVDPGPSITPVTPSVVEKGQTTEIGTVTPGLAGDTLSLRQTGGSGTLALQLVHGVEEVIYTAPSTIANILDTVSYTISDQYNDVATGSKTVPVAAVGDTIYVATAGGSINVGNGNSAIDGRGGNETITAGNGADVIFGGSNDTITVGNGADTIFSGANSNIAAGNGNDAVTAGANGSIKLGNGNDAVTAGTGSAITLGNGNDIVTAGANSSIKLGNGNDTVTAGANSTITVGNGQDKIFAEANDLINLGKGNDTVAFGESPNSTAIGNETITGFNPTRDILQFNPALLSSYSAAHISQVGANTVIQIDHTNSSVTLDNVTAAALSANNFHFS